MIQFLFMVTLLSLAGGPVSASTPLSCAQEPKPASYDTLVAAGHESLEKQQWSQALNIAAAAVGVDTDRYEAYLLACLALHATARHALALEALDNSIARAPEDKHTLLREIGTAIHEATNEKAFEDHLKAGREALESNLAAKAARELTAAWLLKPELREIAVEAALAWIAVQEYGPARALLLKLVKAGAPNDLDAQVRALLALVEPLVAHRYSSNLTTAAVHVLGNRLPSAKAALVSGTELMPERYEAHLQLARLAVLQGTPDTAVYYLREAVQRGAIQRELVLDDERLRTLRDHPGFRELVTDTFGQRALVQLSQPIQVRKGLESELINTLGMRLKRVAPGRFTMGSPASEVDRNVMSEVQTEVILSTAFYMGVTEVTQAQWLAVMENNPSVVAGDSLPVQRVTWLQAAKFCKRLTEREGVLYRLPTEAEWEFVCRAGGPGAYAHGNTIAELKSHGWFKDSFKKDSAPQPVGKLTPNALGFWDMHGNVYEWVMDYYAPHKGEPLTDPMGPDSGTLRIVRGGAYTSGSSACRSAHRAHYPSTYKALDVGFRVVRETK